MYLFVCKLASLLLFSFSLHSDNILLPHFFVIEAVSWFALKLISHFVFNFTTIFSTFSVCFLSVLGLMSTWNKRHFWLKKSNFNKNVQLCNCAWDRFSFEPCQNNVLLFLLYWTQRRIMFIFVLSLILASLRRLAGEMAIEKK